MAIAYFDCFSGISGDMILGALVDAGLDFDTLNSELEKLPLDGFRLTRKTVTRQLIAGTKIDVIVRTAEGREIIEGPGESGPFHDHGEARHLEDLTSVIEGSTLDGAVRGRAIEVFDHLATAESKVHGISKQEVHLHEVSGVDAVVDVVGACIGLALLDIDRVYASALPVGRGFIHCAHGRMPVPAPGALELMRDMPVYHTGIEGELVTPTGAAFLKATANGHGVLPRMILRKIGYGAGTKDLPEHPNLLRVFIGDGVD
ncbi:MAG: LarC family nickel insertion protein [Gemmatimonadota bacterium]|nr:LarC family nickel insertion protein [Gemmatimonadota bacterium]MXW04291.1 LarC family nickel insertion protein [Gemmatimonadota bacterium]MYB62121.1 LarC family nickel insertion protein [Gemmatimonadota bacterium]